MSKPILKFVILSLVSFLISPSQVQAMDLDKSSGERERGGASIPQRKKATEEAAARATALRSEAQKAELLAKQCTDAINEACNHCNSLSVSKLPDAKKILDDRLGERIPDVKHITANANSSDGTVAALTGTGVLVVGISTANPLAIPVYGIAAGYLRYAENRDYNTLMSTMRQKEAELNTSAQAAAGRAAEAASIQARTQSQWKTAVREEAVRRVLIEDSIRAAEKVSRNNPLKLEDSENCFGIHIHKAYNLTLASLDKTIDQLISAVFSYLNYMYVEFHHYYHKPQYEREEFRNRVNSYFAGFSGFIKDLYNLISFRIVYNACDLLTHNDPNLKVMTLKNRNIDDKEIQRICSILPQNHYLEELFLDSNKITDIGVLSICSLLMKNTNLKKISLYNNRVTEQGVNAVRAVLKYNSNLISLRMGGNLILRHELCKVNDIENILIPMQPHEDRLIKKVVTQFVAPLKDHFMNRLQPQKRDSKGTDPQMALEWIL